MVQKIKNISKYAAIFLCLLVQVCALGNCSGLPAPVQAKIRDYLAMVGPDAVLCLNFIAGDNNLGPWLIKNVEQMTRQGSNSNLIILVHLDIKLKKNEKVTRWYLVLNNEIIHLNANDPHTQKMDSGDPETLIAFCKFGLENFKAKHNILLINDHGSGICSSSNYYDFRSSERFKYNHGTDLYEIDRSVRLMDLVSLEVEDDSRGVCWDGTTGNFLSMKDFGLALEKISHFLPESSKRKAEQSEKKFDAIIFDACLMQMLEVANVVKPYAKIMAGSQEAILALGLEYAKTFSIFHHGDKPVTPLDFIFHTVKEYGNFYEKITRDYQFSAIDLSKIDQLEENISEVALLLKQCLQKDANLSVKKALYASKSSAHCTYFAVRNYLDLDHLLRNILSNLHLFQLTDAAEQKQLVGKLKKTIEHGRLLLQEAVLSNVVGKGLKDARGISIYFPERSIHSSYSRAPFAQNNAWSSFLAQYHKK